MNIIQNKVFVESINNALNNRMHHINNFRITEEINFYDEIWDFSTLNLEKRDRVNYKYDFNKISPIFKYELKIVVLNKLFRKKLKFSTVKKVFDETMAISNFFENKLIEGKYILTKNDIKDYFEVYCTSISQSTTIRRINILLDILKVSKEKYVYNYDYIIEYLNELKDKFKYDKLQTAKNKCIPDLFLNQIVSIAINDLNDERLNLRDRMIAGFIVIMAETGMRIEEVSMLEKNMLKSIHEGENTAYYLNFYTFKITANNETKKLTYTFLTDLSLYAYKKLCEFQTQVLNGLSEMSKLRLFIELREDICLNKRIKLTELREIVGTYSKDEIEKIEYEMNRFLFISTETGRQKRGGSLLRTNIEEFFVRHNNDFELTSLSKKSQQDFKRKIITSKSKYNKFFNKQERKKISFEEVRETEYIYTNPHSFRVTVCTKLFRKKIHLDYIIKHLNHLSEDMTMYYNKSVEFEDSIESTLDIFIDNINSSGIIETNHDNVKDLVFKEQLKIDEFKEKIERINDFIINKKLNINKDLKRIMKMFIKSNTTLAENDLGICIVSTAQSLCHRRKYFSSLTDNYHIGINLNDYKNIRYSYQRFKQKTDIINHNKKISEVNEFYKNEYEREKNALIYYIKKTLIKEINLLEEDIIREGKEEIIRMNINLKDIIENINNIKEEVQAWIK
ncbi:hypothetical protein C4D22_04795 [Clostridium perfringens]|nr:tyrosine-type recombinase/integrase [Clostridium perfringens]HBI7133513.1 tyrosine-type recombinase/integrase [Clostridium perfringens]